MMCGVPWHHQAIDSPTGLLHNTPPRLIRAETGCCIVWNRYVFQRPLSRSLICLVLAEGSRVRLERTSVIEARCWSNKDLKRLDRTLP